MNIEKFDLKQARNLAGITQIDMAKRLGISESAYVQYEKYRRYFRVDTADRFSQIVNLPPERIIFFKTKVQKNCSIINNKKVYSK